MPLPIWPVAALLVIAVGASIALRAIDDVRPAEGVVTTQERFAFDPTVIEGSAASIRGLPAGPFHGVGRAHEVVILPAGPFHAPGRAHEVVYGSQSVSVTYVPGLENPGVYVLPGDLAGPSGLPGYRACEGCHQRV
jgi:hypothetical protein